MPSKAEIRALKRAIGKEHLKRAKCSVESVTGVQTSAVACPGCNGQRTQERNDGVIIPCPVCNGAGSVPPAPATLPVPWTTQPLPPVTVPWTWPYYDPTELPHRLPMLPSGVVD